VAELLRATFGNIQALSSTSKVWKRSRYYGWRAFYDREEKNARESKDDGSKITEKRDVN